MSSRDAILAKVRQAGRQPVPLPRVPLFDQDLPPALPRFRAALERIGGAWLESTGEGDVGALIRQRFPNAKVICSATEEVAGTRPLPASADTRAVADVDVGVVRAAFAVAETGSVWLSEREYRVNTLGYLAQHLVVLLDPADIVGNLHHAYRRDEFFAASYGALVSGPSATADIQGVLIRGAQGVRSLTVIPLARPVQKESDA